MKTLFNLRLYLVTDQNSAAGKNLLEIVEQAIEGGVTIVQLREKTLPTKNVIRIGQKLHAVTRRHNIPLIVNDNIPAALAIGAEGVHVGQDDTNAQEARRQIGKNMILGISVATVKEALKAEKDGADYLGVGPVFTTTTKKDAGAAIGLIRLREISKTINIPIVGIGGITQDNATSVIQTGADGVAVVSAIIGAVDPKQAAQELRKII